MEAKRAKPRLSATAGAAPAAPRVALSPPLGAAQPQPLEAAFTYTDEINAIMTACGDTKDGDRETRHLMEDLVRQQLLAVVRSQGGSAIADFTFFFRCDSRSRRRGGGRAPAWRRKT